MNIQHCCYCNLVWLFNYGYMVTGALSMDEVILDQQFSASNQWSTITNPVQIGTCLEINTQMQFIDGHFNCNSTILFLQSVVSVGLCINSLYVYIMTM